MSSAGAPAGYRPDIDGLRALAVVPVVLYHAGVPGFSGGYVGVDIFFVISGFLITGIIAPEVEQGRFSLWSFYERRARRILPALFAMVAAVLVAASLLFLPGDFERVPPSALATLLFAANVWFFSQTGYFSESAEMSPLLHAWSLGVEEQFYILFPLFLLLVARAGARWRGRLVTGALLGSLGWAVATQGAANGFAFYLLPTRAWELLAGAVLALGMVPAVQRRAAREGLALAGIAAILFAVFTYDRATVFPGLAALPPVLGAALLIHCAPGTRTGKLLGWPPAVWVGLASYSLYLWHWPLIVFLRYAQGGPLATWQSAAVVAASLALAAASLRWVETPFRNRARYGRATILTLGAAGIAGLSAVCLTLMQLGPWAERFPPAVGRMAEARHDVSPLRHICLTTHFVRPDARCTLGAAVPPDALLWGDSHGVEFAWVLGQLAGGEGRAIAQRTLGSCPPVLGYSDPKVPDCARFNRAVMAEIAASPHIRTVYLAAFWAGGRYSSGQTAQELGATIRQLTVAGRRVVLIGAVPKQPHAVPRALARAALGHAPPATADRAAYDRDSDWLTGLYPRWRSDGVTIIDPARALFQGDRSRIVDRGHPLYFDSHHLTLAGARLVLEEGARQ